MIIALNYISIKTAIKYRYRYSIKLSENEFWPTFKTCLSSCQLLTYMVLTCLVCVWFRLLYVVDAIYLFIHASHSTQYIFYRCNYFPIFFLGIAYLIFFCILERLLVICYHNQLNELN